MADLEIAKILKTLNLPENAIGRKFRYKSVNYTFGGFDLSNKKFPLTAFRQGNYRLNMSTRAIENIKWFAV